VTSLPDIDVIGCSTTLTAPTATDNCSGSITGTTGTLTFNAPTNTTIVWTYTDAAGNSNTQTQKVKVTDNTPPVLSISAPTLTYTPGACGADVAYNVSAVDGCGGAVSLLYSAAAGHYGPGTYTINVSASDVSGNIATGSFTFTVVDAEKPVTPTLTGATGECSVTLTPPTTSDNCDGVVTGTTTDPLTYTVEGTYTVTWTFTDAAGNSTTATQTATVTDSTAIIAGSVFNDHNTNGIADLGDTMATVWTVNLKSGSTVVATTSTVSGAYSFSNLHSGTYTVEIVSQSGWYNTTATTATVSVACGGSATAAGFGEVQLGAGGALSHGFWQSKNGASLYGSTGSSFLTGANEMNLKTAAGGVANVSNYTNYVTFDKTATATNMANMLSAQAAAMRLNISFSPSTKYNLTVTYNSIVYAPGATCANAFGFAKIGDVVAEAVTSLGSAGGNLTVSAGPVRNYQEVLKTILDKACNNLNFAL
jgi:hypothetical protein